MTRPHATLMYAEYLAKLYQAAGRPLKSINAVDCFALNGRTPQHLFNPTVNLLPYVDSYEWVGVTGLGRVVQFELMKFIFKTPGAKPINSNMIKFFHNMLSMSTCATTPWGVPGAPTAVWRAAYERGGVCGHHPCAGTEEGEEGTGRP